MLLSLETFLVLTRILEDKVNAGYTTDTAMISLDAFKEDLKISKLNIINGAYYEIYSIDNTFIKGANKTTRTL